LRFKSSHIDIWWELGPVEIIRIRWRCRLHRGFSVFEKNKELSRHVLTVFFHVMICSVSSLDFSTGKLDFPAFRAVSWINFSSGFHAKLLLQHEVG
jgi:hypothetical protein